ncbi:formate-dependent phosphoribosylglycinamide formyltransferase [Hydrocarboniclastica marina]|uniref:Formate-dependent phosphoribosylglycinamide formyltransferase n=1 Tax=Hydrocarboniclastica marina TaxID=2259620 RepID=A0A4P7XI60_9ALTE|nr:formate-dependent phosphoribosylglycinamide formyltransferase [Hydrocarboniclastica marina]MAL97152.1 phosphoribosylglycinamide formyltransferase 2 [Alteromonadaceae bacterium]QCF25557.1 formate-dependent phosphoribosylglycinamide formyltransferase [Hydrocarboniclastica marina]
MLKIGTPGCENRLKVLLCGAGELGKEVAIELHRLGVEVVAIDRYENAPAMQVAHRSCVVDMLDPMALRAIVESERPDLIVPEVEAIATGELIKLEREGYRVVPSARAVDLTMNREGIRRLAAEELELKTSPYRFASNESEFRTAIAEIGYPCVVKPVMSSSGKGQSLVRSETEVEAAWDYAQKGGRAGKGRVIVEGWVRFDYEITLLTVQHADGVSFCLPIGHRQEDGDYRESWQPHPMSELALERAQEIASEVTRALGGWGVFGVELFVSGDEVIFSEVSPRPHDTGLVTLCSQDLSEFALHVRAILGLPVPVIRQHGPSASAVILPSGSSTSPAYEGLELALAEPDTELRLFAKPEVAGRRRMGVALARASTLEEAKVRASRAAAAIRVELK